MTPQKRSRRSGVEDLWNKTVRDADGNVQTVRSARHGRGMRWRARYVDERGREHTKAYPRKLDAQLWLGKQTSAIVSNEPGTDRCGPWLIERAIAAVRGQIDGLPEGFTFHDTRHYLASLLIASGADIKTVQARMRHAGARTTLDTYGHLWPDADESTRAAVGAVIAERIKSAAYPLRTEAPC